MCVCVCVSVCKVYLLDYLSVQVSTKTLVLRDSCTNSNFINLEILLFSKSCFSLFNISSGKWVWGESMRLFEAFWVTTFGLLSMMILALISLEQYSRFVRQKQLRTFQVCGYSSFHWYVWFVLLFILLVSDIYSDLSWYL